MTDCLTDTMTVGTVCPGAGPAGDNNFPVPVAGLGKPNLDSLTSDFLAVLFTGCLTATQSKCMSF